MAHLRGLNRGLVRKDEGRTAVGERARRLPGEHDIRGLALKSRCVRIPLLARNDRHCDRLWDACRAGCHRYDARIVHGSTWPQVDVRRARCSFAHGLAPTGSVKIEDGGHVCRKAGDVLGGCEKCDRCGRGEQVRESFWAEVGFEGKEGGA
eukprot:scaffold211702_cov27-Tisochrysis_lutea.AAC.3